MKSKHLDVSSFWILATRAIESIAFCLILFSSILILSKCADPFEWKWLSSLNSRVAERIKNLRVRYKYLCCEDHTFLSNTIVTRFIFFFLWYLLNEENCDLFV